MSTPPVPAQRKVKLITALKATHLEQSTKLQTKQQLEHDLLEDIRSYTKLRATAEKEYAQAILKITSQMLGKFQSKDEKKEEAKTPYGLWRKMLEETEGMANLRMEISNTLQTDVADSIKNLKVNRTVTVKKCSILLEKLHEEIQVSAAELTKAQKTYSDLQKVTIQARDAASDAQEKLRKGTIGLFSSKAKMEKAMSKANERKEVSEKRSTIARNEYLLSIAALNGHQQKYFSLDLPELIAVQDGTIYEDFKSYYSIITNAERKSCEKCVENLKVLQDNISGLERGFANQFFLKENPVFTKCTPQEFTPIPGDTVLTISEESGAGLPLNKEARKWTLRLVNSQKNIRKKTKELNRLQTTSNVETSSTTTEGGTDSTKTTEQSIESLIEEIRHLEVLKTKAESRVEALRLTGVNVDEWLQGALNEPDTDEDDAPTENRKDDFSENVYDDDDDDDFVEEEWDDPSPRSQVIPTYSDDALSTTSSQDQRCQPTFAFALYSFQASSQEELTIYDGEELEVLEREGDGWCRTRNKAGQVGYVPEAYVEVNTRKTTTISDEGTATTSRASSLTGSVNMSDLYQDVPPTPTVTAAAVEPQLQPEYVCFAKATYDYDACEDEELSFKEGDIIMITSQEVDDDDGWWEGILNGKRGVFPSIVVEETKPPDPMEGAQDYPVTRLRTQTADQYATFPRTRGQQGDRSHSLELDSGYRET